MTETEKQELEQTLQKMRYASNNFYYAAINTGNHAFIEFTGLINEYIKVCERCLNHGTDFTKINIHTGEILPVPDTSIHYIEEKLTCIFQGSVQFNTNKELQQQ